MRWQPPQNDQNNLAADEINADEKSAAKPVLSVFIGASAAEFLSPDAR
jgi:hypothetical protein